jgi:TPR repeat protein
LVKHSIEVAATCFAMHGPAPFLSRSTGFVTRIIDVIAAKSVRAALLGFVASCAVLPAAAFDGTQTPADDRSPVEAFKSGARAYKKGDLAGASRALEFAAGKGHALAQWKLARMYSEGDGVPRDDVKAFDYYKAIVEAHSDENPDTPQARFVSSAMVALGSYYLTGIPNSAIAQDNERAIQYFEYAATYFGDSDAQYNLGRLFLDGAPNRPRDPVLAARWLRLAANKGQHQAQAILGHILFAGEDLPRQAARGLMYLTLARDGASGNSDKWIIDLYDQAFAAATPEEREMGLTYLEQFLKEK